MVPRRKTSGTHELAMVTLFPGVQMVLVMLATSATKRWMQVTKVQARSRPSTCTTKT